jgi:uncharacterized membrane protein YphA (DoxX/SURF4 family)
MLRALGRVCFSVLFLWSVAHCIRHGVDAEALVARGVPVGPTIVYSAAVVCAVGTLLLLCNLAPRIGATLLALLLVPTAYLFDVIPLSVVRDPLRLRPERAIGVRVLGPLGMRYVLTPP